jgi:predicted nucleic-acid-binding protein
LIGLDTNILVRYLTQDDEHQVGLVNNLIENELSVENPGYISLIVFIEIGWVLTKCYAVTKAQLTNIYKDLLTTQPFIIERAELANLALRAFNKGNGDFSDALIYQISKANGCSTVLTFDKKARSIGMQLLTSD